MDKVYLLKWQDTTHIPFEDGLVGVFSTDRFAMHHANKSEWDYGLSVWIDIVKLDTCEHLGSLYLMHSDDPAFPDDYWIDDNERIII